MSICFGWQAAIAVPLLLNSKKQTPEQKQAKQLQHIQKQIQTLKTLEDQILRIERDK